MANKLDPARAGMSPQLALRVSPELLEALDREVVRLRAERPGARLQRSDVAREILARSLLTPTPTPAPTSADQPTAPAPPAPSLAPAQTPLLPDRYTVLRTDIGPIRQKIQNKHTKLSDDILDTFRRVAEYDPRIKAPEVERVLGIPAREIRQWMKGEVYLDVDRAKKVSQWLDDWIEKARKKVGK